MGAGWWGEESGPAFIFLLDGFIYNTSADVETICSVAHSLCVISLSLSDAVFHPSAGLRIIFKALVFKANTHTQVSSIFENKGYHVFPRGLEERGEGAENRGPAYFTWQVS